MMHKIPGYPKYLLDGSHAKGWKIWSEKSKRYMSLVPNNRGQRLMCCACIDGKHKMLYLDWAIARIFVPGYDSTCTLAHKDFDWQNNSVKNLVWQPGTKWKTNGRAGVKTKLGTSSHKQAMKSRYGS